MGQTASVPDPNVRLQVIGAGMSRTGTTSFTKALEILLNGPVYHGGTQLLKNDESHIKKWIDVTQHTPARNDADREYVLRGVGQLVHGFAACTDVPTAAFTSELMTLYPDAKVICTVRDADKWWASMEPVVRNANTKVLAWILKTVPVLRYFRQFHDAMDEGRFGELYFRKGERKQPARITYDRHIQWLKDNVPAHKLFFFDVRDGWGPLCKILEVPVPKDVPFPRMNDSEVMADFMKSSIRQGLINWASIIGAGVAATAAVGLLVGGGVRFS
jgi:hypothetical protein